VVTINLHKEIQTIRPGDSGVKLTWDRRFHGKVYYFENPENEYIYVGSSNFSTTGLTTNLEATVLVENQATANRIKTFISWLNSDCQSAYIDKIGDIALVDSRSFIESVKYAKLEAAEAREYDISTLKIVDSPPKTGVL